MQRYDKQQTSHPSLTELILGITALTILLPSTAPSVLSRRSGSVCATLTGKMIPADLGRFFRPYGAEHMHAHPPQEPSQTQIEREREAPPLSLFSDCCSLKKELTRSDAGMSQVWLCFARQQDCVVIPAEEPCSGPDGPPEAPSASQPRGESPSAPPEGREGGCSVFRRALTCEEDSEREPTAKQVVTHRQLTVWEQLWPR